MPYCTIEEAWAKSLTTNELKPYNEQEIFSTVNNYAEYDTTKNMSRTYKKLNNHSGNETRLKEMNFNDSDTDDADFGLVIENTDEEVNETYKNSDMELKKLIKENKNLKKLIKNLRKDTDNSVDNREFILYIFSGIIVIMILENFRKIYKKF